MVVVKTLESGPQFIYHLLGSVLRDQSWKDIDILFYRIFDPHMREQDFIGIDKSVYFGVEPVFLLDQYPQIGDKLVLTNRHLEISEERMTEHDFLLHSKFKWTNLNSIIINTIFKYKER